ncbi:TPA: DEAD/DEAH box helicase, partial [Vibrio parahaemolyticus]|nr:DEAD/DEAH box helicase [Vibrio parahaemolyticus]
MTDKTQQATFADLGLIPTLVERLEALEYNQPTPIQSHAIPHVLDGRDMIGGANTGSGKTAAFSLPILQKILQQGESNDRRGNFVSHLILVPTRELASQVAYNVKSYSYHLR